MNVFLFDIDGTLIDAGGAGQAAMEQSLAEEFGAVGPVSGISTAGRTDRAIAMDLFKFYGIEVTDDHWNRYLKSYFRLLPNSLQNRPGMILPGVRELLQTLGNHDHLKLGLLTGNFAEGAKLKLDHYGLSQHFTMGGFGDEHLDRDDVARTAWQLVRGHHPHVELDRVWVIGDTPSDIRCARAIGAKVLAVATGIFTAEELEPHQPDLLLEDLSDVRKWMQMAGLQ